MAKKSSSSWVWVIAIILIAVLFINGNGAKKTASGNMYVTALEAQTYCTQVGGGTIYHKTTNGERWCVVYPSSRTSADCGSSGWDSGTACGPSNTNPSCDEYMYACLSDSSSIRLYECGTNKGIVTSCTSPKTCDYQDSVVYTSSNAAQAKIDLCKDGTDTTPTNKPYLYECYNATRIVSFNNGVLENNNFANCGAGETCSLDTNITSVTSITPSLAIDTLCHTYGCTPNCNAATTACGQTVTDSNSCDFGCGSAKGTKCTDSTQVCNSGGTCVAQTSEDVYLTNIMVPGNITVGESKSVLFTLNTNVNLNNAVVEGHITQTNTPSSQAIIDINRCGNASEWNFKNDYVNITAGQSEGVMFIFTPQTAGWYDVKTSILSACGASSGYSGYYDKLIGSFYVKEKSNTVNNISFKSDDYCAAQSACASKGECKSDNDGKKCVQVCAFFQSWSKKDYTAADNDVSKGCIINYGIVFLIFGAFIALKFLTSPRRN